MFKDKFNKVVIISIILLLIGILAAFLLSTLQGPHIRFFELQGKSEAADFTNQRVKIFFSSPMNKDNTTSYINISPAAKFRTAWSNNNLFVIFEGNLAADVEYSITFNPEFKDLYQKPLAKNQSIKFKTKPQFFLFVQNQDDQKKLIKSDLNLNKDEVYSNPKIETFDAGGDYAAVITENDNKTNSIQIINLTTKKVDTLTPPDKLITDVTFSPARNEFAYIKQSVQIRPEYTQPLEDTSIVIYNIDTKEESSIDFTTPGEGVASIQFSPDGNSILYKTTQSYYNLIDLSAPQNPILLGRFIADGGFNFDGSKVSFIEFDPLQQETVAQYIVELDAARGSTKITDGSRPVLDPNYFNTQEGIVYSVRVEELEKTKGKYSIKRKVGNDDDIIVRDEKRSLELPKMSFDDRYILIEGYYETDLLSLDNVRSFDFQTKPESGDLLIYDMQTKELKELNTRGYDALWLR